MPINKKILLVTFDLSVPMFEVIPIPVSAVSVRPTDQGTDNLPFLAVLVNCPVTSFSMP
jgi:hypothetical protein